MPELPPFYGKPIDTPTGHKWAGTDWTLVSRHKGGRFYRPVGNVPKGLTWHDARALALTMPYSEDVQVWYVPRHASHAEDRDNLLEDSGKRFPIRWDATPQVFAP